MSVPYIVLVDIDDTLVDARWREHLMPTKVDGGKVNHPSDWDSYNSSSVDDVPIEANVELVRLLASNGYELWGVTSRPEKWREITQDKLYSMGVLTSCLLMRRNDEITVPSPILKPALVSAKLREIHGLAFTKFEDYISFALDDRTDVCEAYRALGIHCLQVHQPLEKSHG